MDSHQTVDSPAGMLYKYAVTFQESPGAVLDTFGCDAENSCHARDQAENSYPGCSIHSTYRV